MQSQKSDVNNVMPGEEPVTTDDLIFQIGEKEADLYRKQIAIKKLVHHISEYDAKVNELTQIIENKKSEVSNGKEIQDLNNSISEYKNTISIKEKEIESLNEKLEKRDSEIQEKLEEERNKVRKLRKQLKNNSEY